MNTSTYRQWADPAAQTALRLLAAGEPAPDEDRNWWDLAACAGYETDLFFPADHEPSFVVRRMCARCPVREPCLQDALSMPPYLDHGVYGGTTEKERLRLRRALRQAA